LATKPTHPQQVAKDQRRPAPGNIIGVRPWAPAQSHSEAAAKLNHGATQNEAIYRALPVQPNGVVRPAAPPAGNVRHRDPNAGVLGGVTTSNNRTTAAIDGSRTNLRSYLRN